VPPLPSPINPATKDLVLKRGLNAAETHSTLEC
jgi:hypothetical protein